MQKPADAHHTALPAERFPVPQAKAPPPTASQCRNRSDIPDRAHHAAVRTAVSPQRNPQAHELNLRHPAPECRSARRQCRRIRFPVRLHARPPSRCRAPYCPRSPARRIRSLRGYGIASVHHAFSLRWRRLCECTDKCCSAPDDAAAEYRYNAEGQNQSRRPEIHTAPAAEYPQCRSHPVQDSSPQSVQSRTATAARRIHAVPLRRSALTSLPVRETACRVTAVPQLRVFLPVYRLHAAAR